MILAELDKSLWQLQAIIIISLRQMSSLAVISYLGGQCNEYVADRVEWKLKFSL